MRTIDPEKHAGKKQQILEAARRCFVRDGFRGAAISAICAEAGISPGHLYHYFPSKEAIVAELAERVLALARAQFGGSMSERPDDLASAIVRIWHAGSEGGGHLMGLEVFAEAARNAALAEILQRASREVRALMTEVMRHGQARGTIDPGLDPEAAATVLISVMDGLRVLSARGSSCAPQQLQATVERLVTSFLAVPAASAAPAAPR